MDDFLATGTTGVALHKIIQQAGAGAAGMAFLVEKRFQDGRGGGSGSCGVQASAATFPQHFVMLEMTTQGVLRRNNHVVVAANCNFYPTGHVFTA